MPPRFKLTDDEARQAVRKGLLSHGILPLDSLTRLIQSGRPRTQKLLIEMEVDGIIDEIEVYYRTQAKVPVVHHYYRLSTGRTDDIVLPRNPPEGSVISIGTHSFLATKEEWETVLKHTPILEFR